MFIATNVCMRLSAAPGKARAHVCLVGTSLKSLCTCRRCWAGLFTERGAPKFPWSGNGPEFVSRYSAGVPLQVWNGEPFHRSGFTLAERPCREPGFPPSGGAARSRGVLQSRQRSHEAGGVPPLLQRASAAQFAGLPPSSGRRASLGTQTGYARLPSKTRHVNTGRKSHISSGSQKGGRPHTSKAVFGLRLRSLRSPSRSWHRTRS